jgi:hypothetical protein
MSAGIATHRYRNGPSDMPDWRGHFTYSLVKRIDVGDPVLD